MRSALLENRNSNIVSDLSRQDGNIKRRMYAACALAKCQKRSGTFPRCIMARALCSFSCAYRILLVFGTDDVVCYMFF